MTITRYLRRRAKRIRMSNGETASTLFGRSNGVSVYGSTARYRPSETLSQRGFRE